MNLKSFPQDSVVKVTVVLIELIELQTTKVFFPHGLHLPVPLIFGNAALTRCSLKLLPLGNPTALTLVNTFLCSLSGANYKWSSCNMLLMFRKTGS